MDSMQKKVWFIVLLLSLTISACSTTGNAAEKPPIDFQEAYLNQQIKLLVIPDWNTFKTTDSVGLKLLYNSQNRITLPENYNLRLFIKQDQGWLEIQEIPTERYPPGDIILSPDKSSLGDDIVAFNPKLADIKKQYTLRAYVFGNMETPDGIVKVGAYVDVVLKP
jgi:hypothetical protein